MIIFQLVVLLVNLYMFIHGPSPKFKNFFFISGAVYEGLWKKNKKCGQGKYFFKNCGEIQCYFINDDIARQKLMPSQGTID